MIEPGHFWLFMTGALALNVTPGPDMAFTLASSMRGGARSGLAAAAGVCVGSLGWAALAAGGLAAILAASEYAFLALRIAGGAYLLFLAARAARRLDALPHARGAATAAGAFRSGALTNLFNPKVGLFFLAFLPAFVAPGPVPVWLQTLALGSAFSLSGGCVLAIVAIAAGAVRRRLEGSARLRRLLNAFAASVFAALGLRLILARP